MLTVSCVYVRCCVNTVYSVSTPEVAKMSKSNETFLYFFLFCVLYRVVGYCNDVVICLERGADLHMVQLMPLPLTVSCTSKIQIGFAFLVPAYPGCPGKEAVKWL